ncbi:molybdate ABC transporter permease subunit [Campylobacter canadensis]|uniref:Molybdenum transport system permease n=1 Tax=Campylobacter canadensis TaxID=449520 RepID=A0ABS7WQP7_9BACT|nr:molybdate ABC transporter permease subunit [Campylobacter canadensis]MBZ7987074.1 molybdate ABC transporter permease subunit [Campylobacter canadensis]MBZ7994688.1 molybdate ABC transporter permease subunit [Campylobacter canadensis]MBZ7996184.1 molybdate ABC transporter permease subunit [Campylobacter canadensis]MBZ7998110.1 molybdate ABC transporter permease subunit [Campylobacter canadensis]MBZ8000000.1 molybdate ABC transporter permease subunit [Campylobacter canadensis]
MYESILLSLKLAFLSTLILLFLCIYPAYFLARKEFFLKKVFLAFISLPLVLPPTALGFYLLILFSPNNALGRFLASFDISFVFNFKAILFASCIYSLPFMFNPLYSAFSQLPKSLYERAFLLGKSTSLIIFRLCLPCVKRSLISAIVMSFAHTMGEFGVIMMIGGSKVGQTKVASIEIFEAIENLDYARANDIALILLLISFCILFIMQFIKK